MQTLGYHGKMCLKYVIMFDIKDCALVVSGMVPGAFSCQK